MPRAIEVHKVPIESVSDASGLSELIEKGVFSADDVIAVVGKTEGNGGVNDYTRIIATHAFRDVLMAMGTRSKEEVEQIPLVWSGGTDGVISPHATIFAYAPEGTYPVTDEPRVTVGSAMSDQILPEDIGRPAMVEKVAAGVRKAMEVAGITDPADVHYVQTKTPLLVQDTINDAERRGQTVFTAQHAPVDGRLQRHDRARHRRGARRDRDADGRADLQRPVALLLGRVVLVGRRARPRADRARRKRARSRRALTASGTA